MSLKFMNNCWRYAQFQKFSSICGQTSGRKDRPVALAKDGTTLNGAKTTYDKDNSIFLYEVNTRTYGYHHQTEEWRDGRTMWQRWGNENCLYFFGRKISGMVPLGRPRRRCEDNIKMKLTKHYGGCLLHLSDSVVGYCEQGKKNMGILMNRGRRGVFSTTEGRCWYYMEWALHWWVRKTNYVISTILNMGLEVIYGPTKMVVFSDWRRTNFRALRVYRMIAGYFASVWSCLQNNHSAIIILLQEFSFFWLP